MENINRENAFKQKKTKPGLKFNPGLSLIGHRTTGPWQLVTMATHMLFLPGIRADRSSKISARTFWVSFKVVSNTESILPLERRIFDPCRPARPPWCNCPKPYELLNCKGDSISAKLHPPPPTPADYATFFSGIISWIACYPTPRPQLLSWRHVRDQMWAGTENHSLPVVNQKPVAAIHY